MSKRVLSLFSGAGGAVEGFKRAGYDVVAAVDFDEDCIATLEANHSDVRAIQADLSEVEPEEFAEGCGIRPDDVDVVIGGPPCQGFSTAGKRDPDDERNTLVEDFLDYVEHYEPRAVVMENVIGILSMEGGKVKDYILECLEGVGCDAHVDVHDATDYGVPQKRKRVIFIGFREERGTFSPSVEERDEPTVCDALDKVIENHPNHIKPNHQEKTVERIRGAEQGEAIYDSFNKNVRLDPDEPAPTLVSSGGAWKFGHPEEARALTVHERALLQSFPPEYVFCGGRNSGRIQTGNASPPKMMEAIAESL